jgi:hypothetical protein
MAKTINTKHVTDALITLCAGGAIDLIAYNLPDYIKAALPEKFVELECFLEAVIEIATTSLPDK